MNRSNDLSAFQDRWETVMGMVFPGKRVVFRGKDLFSELKHMSWIELLLYGITGRNFDRNQLRLFESIWIICTSYPDPRIWNNRVATLAGTARSTGVLGVSAAIAISEATIYGYKPIVGSHDLIVRIKKAFDEGKNIDTLVVNEIKKSRSLPGYARPLVNTDERIEPLMSIARDLGLADGPHTQIAFEIETILLKRRYRMRMNIAALAAALAADQGLSTYEYYLYLIPCFISGMIPCYIEAANVQEGSFFPLSCDRIQYEGKDIRPWL